MNKKVCKHVWVFLRQRTIRTQDCNGVEQVDTFYCMHCLSYTDNYINRPPVTMTVTKAKKK